MRFLLPVLLSLFSLHPVLAKQADTVVVLKRYVSIDNVCAWPNLTTLNDGTQIVSIFNKPSHGRMQGDVECWASTDGGAFWTKRGTPTSHKPMTNRMNVAAGLATNGDMVVIASGWSLKESGKNDGLFNLVDIIPAWVSRSKDDGKTWQINENDFPAAEPGFTSYIPFGDILKANDGSLRVLAYNQSNDKVINTVSMFRSGDDGKTWKWFSRISDAKDATAFSKGHNETAFFHTGNGRWIAAARRWKEGQAMDLFSSEDDGKTWKMAGPLTESNQHPGHITRLKNGDLLLTFGNRKTGFNGVAVKTSKDNGKTWSDTQLIISDLASFDCGYPASVQLEDGSIMTVYYANANAVHQRYHMGTVVWRYK
ncbi:MAG: exo-alpha-sialidase [Chitinophagaceae bacterium]|nr:exo-alpha-sialidase [Chitinophagaceae bacterium]